MLQEVILLHCFYLLHIHLNHHLNWFTKQMTPLSQLF